jgi:hypothetical protein
MMWDPRRESLTKVDSGLRKGEGDSFTGKGSSSIDSSWNDYSLLRSEIASLRVSSTTNECIDMSTTGVAELGAGVDGCGMNDPTIWMSGTTRV